ncbi:hypothetical protein LEP3755_11630 [Leptolyngbya sp. NIES-3755]|nr:hypothetical protein LEP3755_11630 [Leptolyngbya sp. NIES-3755]
MSEEQNKDVLISVQAELTKIVQKGTNEKTVAKAELQIINKSAAAMRRAPMDLLAQLIRDYAKRERDISEEDVRILIDMVKSFFRKHLLASGYQEKKIKALITKFRDAGRRSAPWKPTSTRVPGRPQDGADGNRQSRWLLPPDHKFYASEVDATLVEIKYFLQTLAMQGAPVLPPNFIQESFHWLLGHSVEPGQYLDPIQLIPIEFQEFINEPRLIQSGHLTPLDRGGRHVPDNTFLMLARSNQIQGNQTLEELLELMERVVSGYQQRRQKE